LDDKSRVEQADVVDDAVEPGCIVKLAVAENDEMEFVLRGYRHHGW
jgi:hypothetical protein